MDEIGTEVEIGIEITIMTTVIGNINTSVFA